MQGAAVKGSGRGKCAASQLAFSPAKQLAQSDDPHIESTSEAFGRALPDARDDRQPSHWGRQALVQYGGFPSKTEMVGRHSRTLSRLVISLSPSLIMQFGPVGHSCSPRDGIRLWPGFCGRRTMAALSAGWASPIATCH